MILDIINALLKMFILKNYVNIFLNQKKAHPLSRIPYPLSQAGLWAAYGAKKSQKTCCADGVAPSAEC